MKKISCVICAYNEEKRIGAVLQAVASHPVLEEVLVVDDGSSDRTKEIVQSFPGVRLISYGENRGKSYAITAGIAEARCDLLMMIDADLVGLTQADITALAEPVLSGKADLSISLRKNSLFIYKLIGLDFVSGERVLPKKLLADKFDEIRRLPGFGLESFMNKLIIKERLHISIVKWSNVISPRKSKKIGFWRGMLADFQMIRQILKVVSIGEIIRQNFLLRSLSRPK